MNPEPQFPAYRYNAEGNRVRFTSTSETTTLTVDPQGALPKVLERVKNGIRTRYVYGAGLQYEVNDAGAATYYHYDQSGNTAALTNQAGAIIEREVYSPYGTIRYRQSNFDTPFLYGGVLRGDDGRQRPHRHAGPLLQPAHDAVPEQRPGDGWAEPVCVCKRESDKPK